MGERHKEGREALGIRQKALGGEGYGEAKRAEERHWALGGIRVVSLFPPFLI